VWGVWIGIIWLRIGTSGSSCEQSNAQFGSTKDRAFPDYAGNYHILKNNLAPWSCLLISAKGPLKLNEKWFLLYQHHSNPLFLSLIHLCLFISFASFSCTSMQSHSTQNSNKSYQPCYVSCYLNVFMTHIKDTSKSHLMVTALAKQNILPPRIATQKASMKLGFI
jgi:hypothetical protein